MAGENVTNSTGDIKEPTKSKGTTKGSGTGNNRNSNTTTGTDRPNSGTDRPNSGTDRPNSGTDRPNTGTTEGKQIKENSKVSVLKDLPEVTIPQPAEPKQKRKYTKKAKTEEKTTSFDSNQISAFIVAVSSMVASREGCQHWLISQTEAEQIAKPLSNIIAKSENLKVLGEHADAFALVSACLMIVVPRLLITLQTKKNKSKKGSLKNAGKTTGSNTELHKQSTTTPTNDDKTIFDAIPAI